MLKSNNMLWSGIISQSRYIQISFKIKRVKKTVVEEKVQLFPNVIPIHNEAYYSHVELFHFTFKIKYFPLLIFIIRTANNAYIVTSHEGIINCFNAKEHTRDNHHDAKDDSK